MNTIKSTDLSSVLTIPPQRGLAESVSDRLREVILAGHFAPGERLREEALAQSLGVSRGPVREALRLLEREGLVVIRPNRGAFVARLAPEDLDEIYTLRLAIERLAVQLAVVRASEGQLDAMQQTVAEMARLTIHGITEREAAELDMQFHDLLYEAAGHRRLNDTWTTLRPQIYVLLLSRNVAQPDFREMTLTSHEDLLAALRSQDEARAVASIEEHLRGSYERVKSGANLATDQLLDGLAIST